MKNLRNHISNRLDHIVAFTHGERARERLASDEFNSRVRRMALVAVMATPGLPEFLYEQRVVSPYRAVGYNVIGLGTSATTLDAQDGTVLKILHKTRNMPEASQRAEIDRLERLQDVSLKYLEQFIPVQEFSIGGDPLSLDKDVVIARQEKVDGRSATPMLRGKEEPTDAFNDFIDAAEKMKNDGVAVPDLLGSSNLLVGKAGGIHLIDTICTVNSTEDGGKAFKRNCQVLDEALSRR